MDATLFRIPRYVSNWKANNRRNDKQRISPYNRLK
jgi:hypothetical protein